MRRRKFLIGAGSLAAGTAGALGTGAYNQITAQRDISLTIRPDSADKSYLNFTPLGQYANYPGGGGNLNLSFPKLNSRANSLFENVFRIENQGPNAVEVLMPSFTSVSTATLRTAAAAASTNFLVDASDSPVSSPQGVRLAGSSSSTESVSKVDISWPENTAPTNKPSNPVPQDDNNLTDGFPSQVDGTYTGLRYPGGTLELPPGSGANVDVRFTVSNERNSDDSRSAGLLYKAKTGSVSNSDWEV